ADLGELRRDRVILRHLQAEALGKRTPPAVWIGDRLVVVAGVEDDVALGMGQHVEADRSPINIALAADLQGSLGEAAERSRREDIKLLRLGWRSEREQTHAKSERTNQEFHRFLPAPEPDFAVFSKNAERTMTPEIRQGARLRRRINSRRAGVPR